MNSHLNFIAIDFETATAARNSVCEIGICVVRNGEVSETRSWLVQPPENRYHYMNMRIHGIKPADTADAAQFDEVWDEIERDYLDEFDLFVAHNASFDRSCLHKTAEHYGIHLPALRWECTCNIARRIYGFSSNTLDYLCSQLGIPQGTHHQAGDDAEMCALLYLREQIDKGGAI